MTDIKHEIQTNEFVRSLLESIGDGIFVLDPKGLIIAWNPAMEKITGYLADEVKYKSCRILYFSQCFEKECPTTIQDCGILKRGRVEPTECLLKHKSGHNVSVTKNARVIKNKNDEIIGIVEAVTDLTELKNARLKMEEATRRLGELNRLGGIMESELFGHVKGAFTGAGQNRIGRFEQADGGTVFLDEIGEITPYIQVKLLRVLQQKEIERVGESRTRRIDIRVITALNKNLKSLVDAGTFREDLYYRLKVFPIYLPPLRERKEDIPLLVNHFIKTNNTKSDVNVKGISKSALKALMDYAWPGNIRELANAIEHAFVLCSGREIYISDLPFEIRTPSVMNVSSVNSLQIKPEYIRPQRQKLTKEILLHYLHESNWNKAEVGRRVGLSRASIWKYMKKWDIPLQPL